MKRFLKSQKGFSHFEAILLLLIVAAIGFVGVYVAKNHTSHVSAAPTMPPNATLMAGQLWMIKDNDLKVIGNVGHYEWVGCGLTTGTPIKSLTYAPCQTGQTPIYTSEETMASDAAANKLVSSSGWVIYDNEKWSLTPKVEKNNAALYEQKAIQLAHANGLKIINTPYAGTVKEIINRDVAAAKAGADVIDLQLQGFNHSPNVYVGHVKNAVAAIRAVNPNVIILAGLSTDSGGTPVGEGQMYSSWKGVKDDVQGFWLNANVWTKNAHGCASTGCPITAIGFLKEIGAIK